MFWDYIVKALTKTTEKQGSLSTDLDFLVELKCPIGHNFSLVASNYKKRQM